MSLRPRNGNGNDGGSSNRGNKCTRSQLGVPLQIGEGKVAGLLKAVIPRGDGMIMLLDMEKFLFFTKRTKG